MRFYKFVVEALFVRASGFGDDIGGFYATFFINSSSVVIAFEGMQRLLSDRMSAHFVSTVEGRVFSTHFYVCDVREVAEEKMHEIEGRDLGFKFFRISEVERVYLAFRCLLLRMFRPRSVFFLDQSAWM